MHVTHFITKPLSTKKAGSAVAVDIDEATIRVEVADDVRSSMAMLLVNADRLDEAVKFNPGRFCFTHENLDKVERFISTFAPIIKRFNQTGEFNPNAVPDVTAFHQKD